MEPLTGFFILEGLTFDIIGVVLIVTGIFDFKQDNKLESNAVVADQIRAIFKLIHGNLKGSQFTSEDVGDLFKEIPGFLKKNDMTFKDILYETALDEELHKSNMLFLKKDYYETRKFSQNRAISGLSFLIGGFLLQGIGIINQLL